MPPFLGRPVGGRKRRFVFIFLQLEIGRYDVEPGKIGRTDDLADRLDLVIITQRLEQRGRVVELRLDAVQGGERSLRVEIDRQHAMPCQRQILGEVGRGRGLAAATLEIDHGENLEIVARATMRHVKLLGAAVLVQKPSQFQDLFGRIGAPAGGRNDGGGAFALQMEFLDMVLGNAEKLGDFGNAEQSQALLRIRRELLDAQQVELIRDKLSLIKNLVGKISFAGVWNRLCRQGITAIDSVNSLRTLFIRRTA